MKKWSLSLVIAGIFFLSFFRANPIFAEDPPGPRCETQSDCPTYGWCDRTFNISWNAVFRECSGDNPPPGIPKNTCFDYYAYPGLCDSGKVCVDHGDSSSCEFPSTPTATPTPDPCAGVNCSDTYTNCSETQCGGEGYVCKDPTRYRRICTSSDTRCCTGQIETCGAPCVTPTPTPTPTPTCPTCPIGVFALAVRRVPDDGNYNISLSWNDVANEGGYQIFRYGNPIANVGSNVTSFVDTNCDSLSGPADGCPFNTSRTYEVRPIREGCSLSCGVVNITWPSGTVSVFPTSGSAYNECSYNVYFSWSNASQKRMTYQHSDGSEIVWCNPCDNWVSPATGYTPAGKTTTYRVYDGLQLLATSSPPFTCNLSCPGAPAAPWATSVLEKSIQIRWNDVNHEEGYEIQYSNDQTNWTSLGFVGADVVSFIHNLSDYSCKFYYYRIGARRTGCATQYSLSSGGIWKSINAPTNLSCSVLSSPPRNSLSWTDNSGIEGEFRIQRSVDGGAFTDHANAPADNDQEPSSSSYIDSTNVQQGRTYSYKIRAQNISLNCYSDFTPSVSCSQPTSTPAPTPTNTPTPTATPTPTPTPAPACPACSSLVSHLDVLRSDGNYNKNISWADVTNEGGYKIYLCTTTPPNTCTPIYLITLAADSTSYTATNNNQGFTPGTRVIYEVRPFKTGCYDLNCDDYTNNIPTPIPTPTTTPTNTPTPTPTPTPTSTGWFFRGNVYQKDTTNWISGATVKLYGSNTYPSIGNYGIELSSVSSGTTNLCTAPGKNCNYRLNTSTCYRYFSIVKTENPPGYNSYSATAPGDRQKTTDWILYDFGSSCNLNSRGYYYDNNFFLVSAPTSTPTPTPTATPTPTPSGWLFRGGVYEQGTNNLIPWATIRLYGSNIPPSVENYGTEITFVSSEAINSCNAGRVCNYGLNTNNCYRFISIVKTQNPAGYVSSSANAPGNKQQNADWILYDFGGCNPNSRGYYYDNNFYLERASLPWFQTRGGDVHAKGEIYSPIPAGNYFSFDGLGGFPGLVSYGESANFGRGGVSSRNWLANTQSRGSFYDFFVSLFKPMFVNPPPLGEIGNNDLGDLIDGGVKAYNGDIQTKEGLNIGIKKIVLFGSGRFLIKNRISVDQGGSLVVITRGDIGVSKDFGGANMLDGFFVTDGTFYSSVDSAFNSSNSNKQLIINGGVAAKSFNLGRDLNSENRNSPAEKFIYRPDFFFNFYSGLWIPHHLWEELAP